MDLVPWVWNEVNLVPWVWNEVNLVPWVWNEVDYKYPGYEMKWT